VGEVGTGVDPYHDVHRLLVVVEHGDLLAEPAADGPLADDRQLGVDVDRPGAGDQEKPGLEVVEIIHGERAQPTAVHGQCPLGQEAGVVREEPGRVGEGRVDVTALVADHERVSVQNLDETIAHDCLPGNSRWPSTNSSGSPDTISAPRSTAAVTFC